MATGTAGRQHRALLLGLMVVALFGLSIYVAVIAARGLPFSDYAYARAAFDDVGPLRPGDDVRMNSVRVGQVSEIEYVDDRAVVTMQLQGDRQVHGDARATVVSRSALGQKFVELDPGRPGAGELGDEVIPESRTGDSRDLDYLLDALDAPTRRGAVSTLRNVGGGLAGHSEDLHDFVRSAPSTLTSLGEVSAAAGSSEAEIVAMLQSADALAGRFAGRQEDIAALLRQTDSTLAALAVDRGEPLRRTLTEAPGTLAQAEVAFDALDQPLRDLESGMRTLEPGARALGSAAGDLRGFLRESTVPLEKVPGVARQASPAVRELTRTLADARPLVPAAGEALASARTPLEVLSPYAPEVSLWFTYARSVLGDGTSDRHWLRFNVPASSESGSGASTQRDPMVQRNPYPAPGTAGNDRKRISSGGAR